MFEGYEKISSIIRIKELNLPTPDTIFVSDINSQAVDLNNFLEARDFVIIRSDKIGKSSHCPCNIKCSALDAKFY